MESSQDGYVYIFRDQLNDNIIKVGLSKNPFNRIKKLYNTSTPLPLNIRTIWWVANMRYGEKIAHSVLYDHRINDRREFFEIAPSPHFNLFERTDYETTSICLDVLIELIENAFCNFSLKYAEMDVGKMYEEYLKGEI